MKKLFPILLILCSLIACSTEEKNLSIQGRVQGLKKGTLYLQRIQDTVLVTMDSIVVKGNEVFSFETNIDGPEVLYLYLNKKDNNKYDDRIQFFAEPGEMVINTTLKDFEGDAIVEGSENQKKLMEYQSMIQKFNSRNVELFKRNIVAQQQQNQATLDSTNVEFDNLLKRKYLYTINFALNNKDFEVAPYLAITEVYDANTKYLDTIFKSLPQEVKNSSYGQSLEELLKERKQREEKAAANPASE